jgi:hypothetical protein
VVLNILDILPMLSLNYGFMDLLIFAGLIIVGIIILVFLVKLALMFLPAIIIAGVVWFLTDGSLFWAAIAFLVIAVIGIARRI